MSRSTLGSAARVLPLGLVAGLSCTPPPAAIPETTVVLRENWRLAPSAEITAAPAELSSPGYDASRWTPTFVPATVLAALVRSGVVEDPYFGRKLEQIPTEQFATPWWYRTELAVEGPVTPGSRLVLEGINYSADLWLNGRQIAGREEIFGAFRRFDLDVSSHLVSGVNALAVKVYPPEPGDPTIGFVDWNPRPPDRNMGLWREVKLRRAGAVMLDQVFVRSDIDLEGPARASLTIEATLRNPSERRIAALVRGKIGEDVELEDEIELGPGESRELVLSPERFAQLVIEQPRLWWPNHLGEPELYDLDLQVLVGGRVSDRQRVTFGIRRVEDYMDEQGHRGYKINGKKLLVRGAGWVDDLMLADDDQRILDQIRYVRHLNLNAIRLEGFWGTSQRLYDLADRYGILVMVGWSCQWEWEEYLEGPVDEYGGIDTPEEIDLVTRSLRDQVTWLRNHPSVLVWVLASDMLPRPELERRYRADLAAVDPTRPVLAACSVRTSEVSGPSGVKMNGPYDWVPPIYWYVDRERGGAYGFNTETGPGPQPPPADSLRRMLPEASWWPPDEMWDYHSGRNQFNTIATYRQALDARYGKATDLEGFARRAQLANYEGMRAMFEAFSIRRPATTGIIQWMLNSAWPELYWQLYDHYLVPNGAFYGARDAGRPINVAYDREDRRVVVVNDTPRPLEGVHLRVRMFDLRSETLFDQAHELDVAAESLARVLTVPEVRTEGEAYLLHLALSDPNGVSLVSSLYWLAAEEDELEWDRSEWFYTPTSKYADLSGLFSMPEVELEVDHRFEPSANGQRIQVTLMNPSDRIAFFVELRILRAESGRRAAPILWSDNYVSLLPGERLEIEGEIPAHALAGDRALFRYGGVNVAEGAIR